MVSGGTGYTFPTVTISGGGGTGATASAIVGTSPVSSIAMSSGGTGYLAPTVTISGGGGTGATATATVGTSPVNSITVTKGGLKYKIPTVNIIPVDGNGTGAAATATIDGTGAVTGITVKNVGSGYTTAPRITITDGPTRHSGPTTATATATVSPTAGSLTGITFTGGLGYTSAPSVTITDATGTGAIATATVSPTAGTVTGITATGGTGYTSAPIITIVDIAGGTGTGASAKAILGAAAGAVTGITVTNTGSGYTSVPSIAITDPNPAATGASATVPLEFGPGVVTGITITNAGTGYTSVPSITIADGAGGAGTGASATATISGTSGAGAQATVTTSNSQSIPVRTKAEQELFDTYGRYNSTGGVELHLGSQAIQTTVPLSYIDSPTEIIGDSDTQVWKIVDNGFWSNSMHFDFVDVQLINRVGWDGTVKAPASNEVGWKDTLRLNPLEDVVIAMRAKRPAIPFGLPQSSRAQDPSVALGVAGSNLGFIIDPGVMTLPTDTPPSTRLLTTTTNVMTNYDNEYIWNSAILGHSEDDFIRPIVYKPIVTTPDAPTNLTQNAGTLAWTDPTPALLATTLANPKNEIGFIVQRASGSAAFAEVARVPANATSWVDAKQVLGIAYSYQVTAYNAMGNSLPSNIIAAKSLPAAPSGVTAVAGALGSRSITVNWTASPANVTGYTVQNCQMNTALTACGAWSTIGTAGANITTFKNNTRLTRGRSYRYQVMANAGAGLNSAYAGPSNTVVAP